MERKYFNSINDYYRETFGSKVYKLALDIGSTCPNRDGTLGRGGCIFCSGAGSGDYAAIDMQLDSAVERLGDKATGKYIAYFQSFTNTYMSVERLSRFVDKALEYNGVVGIAISTRPDCISEDMLDYLADLSKVTHLTIELGMQTSKDSTLELCHRGCKFACLQSCVERLHSRGIRVCLHIMNGLPGESREDMLDSIRAVNRLHPHSVKLHCTYVVEGTRLADMYERGEFETLGFDEYIDLLCEEISLLDKDIYIERLTGDGARAHLIEPKWTLSKRYFLNALSKALAERGVVQGNKKD